MKITPSDLPTAHAVINELTLKNEQLMGLNKDLQQRLDWLKRELFGKKSEKVIRELPGPMEQLWLGGVSPATVVCAEDSSLTIAEHARKRHGKATIAASQGYALTAQCQLRRFSARLLKSKDFRLSSTRLSIPSTPNGYASALAAIM